MNGRPFADTNVLIYDALILAAARLAGCAVVFSEDLSHGQDYDGVRVENPFRGLQVDFVLEDGRGRVMGIEVKKTASPGGNDFKGLRHLQEMTGLRFLRGVLLYTGTESVAFGSNLHAVPVNSLWQFASDQNEL